MSAEQQIDIIVRQRYSAERSDPARHRWFFIYTITITNNGSLPAQLVSRHWVITDARGNVEEVRGPGVVGEQPRLQAGESFEYTSGCPLSTPFGSMKGSYTMVGDGGDEFEVNVPAFALRDPANMQ